MAQNTRHTALAPAEASTGMYGKDTFRGNLGAVMLEAWVMSSSAIFDF